MILEGETILADDYPVYWGYCYVACGDDYPADGEVVQGGYHGTVGELKRALGAAEIRRCEIIKRQKMASDGRLAIPG